MSNPCWQSDQQMQMPPAFRVAMSRLRGTSGFQMGLLTKATPSIKWTTKTTKVQCNLCGVEVSLKKLEHHRNLRCHQCGHHHRHHGTLENCCSCIKHCKKCGPFHSRLRQIPIGQRCDCGHYHANGRICSSLADLSQSVTTTSLPREHHSDSDSTAQSLVSCDKRH